MKKITKWKRIFATYISDRGSISRIEEYWKNVEETSHPIEILSMNLNREWLPAYIGRLEAGDLVLIIGNIGGLTVEMASVLTPQCDHSSWHVPLLFSSLSCSQVELWTGLVTFVSYWPSSHRNEFTSVSSSSLRTYSYSQETARAKSLKKETKQSWVTSVILVSAT